VSEQDTAQSIRRNRRFISKAMSRPLLTAEHELDLATRWRHDQDVAALHELVQAYMRLVVATATRFRGYGLPLADLVQEGCVGLMQAAARFEPERGVRFSTYATWWIRSAMQEFVLRNWSIVRPGTSATQKSLFFNLRGLRARIEGVGGGALTPAARAEIAVRLGVKEREVEIMAGRLSVRDQSLNKPVGLDGGDELADLLVDDGISPEDAVLSQADLTQRRRWLARALGELSEREQFILRERRLAEDRKTLEQLGGRLGITKERVRQIEHKAFEKLSASVLRLSRAASDAASLKLAEFSPVH